MPRELAVGFLESPAFGLLVRLLRGSPRRQAAAAPDRNRERWVVPRHELELRLHRDRERPHLKERVAVAAERFHFLLETLYRFSGTNRCGEETLLPGCRGRPSQPASWPRRSVLMPAPSKPSCRSYKNGPGCTRGALSSPIAVLELRRAKQI